MSTVKRGEKGIPLNISSRSFLTYGWLVRSLACSRGDGFERFDGWGGTSQCSQVHLLLLQFSLRYYVAVVERCRCFASESFVPN